MAKTTEKGEIGEAMILADLRRQGHQVAIPFGHNLPFDLIVVRKEDGRLEKVQCKYTTSDGKVIQARITSSSAWVSYRYSKEVVDWIAVYDATTNGCFYLPSDEWDGLGRMNLRLVEPANSQRKGIRFANEFVRRGVLGMHQGRDGSDLSPVLPLGVPPE